MEPPSMPQTPDAHGAQLDVPQGAHGAQDLPQDVPQEEPHDDPHRLLRPPRADASSVANANSPTVNTHKTRENFRSITSPP